MANAYLEVTPSAGQAFFSQPNPGPVVMLNLLRFRAVADYSASPELAPPVSSTGAAAYRRYMEHTAPFLEKSGGEVIFYGSAGNFLIGPQEEKWDAAMLVRQKSMAAFLAFATNQQYLAGMGHRTAALEDSRLLPLATLAKEPGPSFRKAIAQFLRTLTRFRIFVDYSKQPER